MRKSVRMDPLQNVAPGQKCTLIVPVGLTYDQIIFKYAGVTLDQIQNVTLKLNSKSEQQWPSLGTMKVLNDYYKRHEETGMITWHFNTPELFELGEQRLTGLGTHGLGTITIEMFISADATAPVIEAFAVQSEAQEPGLITKIREFPVSFSTSGQQLISNLPTAGERIKAIHLIKSDVSKFDMTVDSVNVFDLDKDVIEAFQRNHGRVPQTASATHIDFCLEGDPAQSLTTMGIQSLQMRPTIETQGNMTVLVEYLGAALQGI